MEIILREHVDNLGRRGDVVNVAAGYARNYLLPRKLALPVTVGNRRQIERERKLVEVREAGEKQAAEAFAARIGAVAVRGCPPGRGPGRAVRIGHGGRRRRVSGRPRGSRSNKRKVQLDEPIRKLGDFTVPIKVHREVTAQVALKVVKAETDE